MLSGVAREYKERIKQFLEVMDNKYYSGEKLCFDADKKWLNVAYYFFFTVDVFFSTPVDFQGTNHEEYAPSANDVSNFIKLFEDEVATYTGIDDRYVNSIFAAKLLSGDLDPKYANTCFIATIIGQRSERFELTEKFKDQLSPMAEFANAIRNDY